MLQPRLGIQQHRSLKEAKRQQQEKWKRDGIFDERRASRIIPYLLWFHCMRAVVVAEILGVLEENRPYVTNAWYAVVGDAETVT